MSIEPQAQARVLIVDDSESRCRLLVEILHSFGFSNVRTVKDPRQVLALYTTFRPDVILLDLWMPYLDGFAILEQLRPRVLDGLPVPIIVLTADDTPEAKQRALSLGAKDFLTAPFDDEEVRLRISNLLETRLLQARLRGQNKILEEQIEERTDELERARLEIVRRLALAAEYRDDNTGKHAERVGKTSGAVALNLGKSTTYVDTIKEAAPLHDVGKIGISDQILLKPGKLTSDEFDLIKTHTAIGARILSGSRVRVLQIAEEIALTHHERWDGRGYHGLKGDAIPLCGRIVAIADVFDALKSDRPYKSAWTHEQAIEEIESQRGKQFDPDVVDAFVEAQETAEVIRLDTVSTHSLDSEPTQGVRRA